MFEFLMGVCTDGMSSSKLVVGKSLRWTIFSLSLPIARSVKCNEIEQDYKRFMANPCFRYPFNVVHSTVQHSSALYRNVFMVQWIHKRLQFTRLNIEFSSLLFVVLTTESRTHFRLISSLLFTDTKANLKNWMLVFASAVCAYSLYSMHTFCTHRTHIHTIAQAHCKKRRNKINAKRKRKN